MHEHLLIGILMAVLALSGAQAGQRYIDRHLACLPDCTLTVQTAQLSTLPDR